MDTNELNNIKEVIFHWDWSYIIIPQNEIKLFKYNKIKEELNTAYSYIKCDYVCIEINLDYLKTNYNDTEYSLFDYIKGRNIWDIEVIMQNKEKIYIELPTYRKESYFPNTHYLSMDAINLCEKHSMLQQYYKIEWALPSTKDIWMNYQELLSFFEHGILSTYYTQHEIGIELFERILKSNIKNRNLQNIDSFSILKRIRESSERTKKLYRRKVAYKVNEECDSTYGIKKIHLNFSNHSYKWNLTFLFVDSSTYNKTLDSVLKQLCLPDTSHFFHKTILIFKDENNIDEFTNSYTSIPQEMFLYTTVQEINDLWYHIHEEANLV